MKSDNMINKKLADEIALEVIYSGLLANKIYCE